MQGVSTSTKIYVDCYWNTLVIYKKRNWFWNQHVSMSNWFVLFCFLVIHLEFWIQLINCPFITCVLASLWVQPETGRAWNGWTLHSPASSLHKSGGKVVSLFLKTQPQHRQKAWPRLLAAEAALCAMVRGWQDCLSLKRLRHEASVLTQSSSAAPLLSGMLRHWHKYVLRLMLQEGKF